MSGISRVLRSATLFGYAELAQSLGLEPDPLLRHEGLSREMLNEPDHPIDLGAACRVLEASALASGVEDFGLRLAASRKLANLGAVGVVMREEATGLAALYTLTRYLQLVNPALITQVEVQDETVLVREDVWADLALPMRQPLEMAVGVMHGILRELLGAKWVARRVCFTHRAPRDSSFHKRYFACPMDFNADFNGVVCRRSELEAVLPGRNAERVRQTHISLDRALAQTQQRLSESVRQLIAVLLPQGRCSAAQVAAMLGVDRRTVHRQLAFEAENFSGLLQNVRLEFAQRQLRDSDRSATDVAGLLGFGSASAFAHWFAQHHGCSVTLWRKQLLSRRAVNPSLNP
jgi:AraC-like DNA-binding protein